MKRYIMIFSALCCMMLTGCTFLEEIITKPTETLSITQGDVIINIRMNKAYVREFLWDGDVSHTDIVIPDTVVHPDTGKEIPVTALGGVYGTGVPMPFVINGDNNVYAPGEGAEIRDIVFNIYMGQNIDGLHCGLYHIRAEGDDTLYYKPYFRIVCSEDNPVYYSKDGRLYSRTDDALIDDFPYPDESGTKAEETSSVSKTADTTVSETEISAVTSSETSAAADTQPADDDMPDAYKELLELYLYVQDNELDNLETGEAGLDTALTAYGWPFAGFGEDSAGYFLYDLDNNGTPELFITLGSSVLDIWSCVGGECVHAYACPYRGDIFIYEDGTMTELFGTMHAASTKLFRYDTLTGRALPVVQYAYDPSADSDESDEYHIFAAEYDRESIENEYKDTGIFPDRAYQWKDITKEEYESRLRDVQEADLPEPVPIISLQVR